MSGDRADLQAQFSIAYVQAVASVAGFFVQQADRGFDKDGIDLTVLRRGEQGLITSMRLDIQVKSYSRGRARRSLAVPSRSQGVRRPDPDRVSSPPDPGGGPGAG